MQSATRNDSEKNENRTGSTIGNLVSGRGQSDGSTVIHRTMVERSLRPKNDGQTSTVVAITTIARQHEDEQRELQELNAKFAVYLDRVHYLEDHNQRLNAELKRLKDTWGSDATRLHSEYGPQLKSFRDGIDNALRDQALQELQLKRHEYDLWQIQQQIAALDGDKDLFRINILKQELDASAVELEHLKNQFDQRLNDLEKSRNLMENLLKDVYSLKNELDNQQLERIIIENELQTLREHAAFQDAIYQAQREDLFSLSTPVLDVSSFYRAELARAIFDIRQDFEVLSQSQANELEEYYRVKTEEIRGQIESENERKRLLVAQGTIESMDKTVLTSSLKDNQTDLIELQNNNKQLQSQLDALIDDLEKIQDEQLRQRQTYDQQLGGIRQQIDDKQATIDGLLENNVSLRFELSTYRRLLDVEEKHLNRMEQGKDLQNSSSQQNQLTLDRTDSPNELGTKKMTVQKTARGPISFESVDLDSDSIALINEKFSGNEQSFRNWTIRRQIDQQPEIVYQFPSTFSLRPRQMIRILSKRSSQSAKSKGDNLVADSINTWGIGRKMVTRLVDNNSEEKAVITQIIQ